MMRIALIAMLVFLPMQRQTLAHPASADLAACVEFLAGGSLTQDEQERLAGDEADAAAASGLLHRIQHTDQVTRAGLRIRLLADMYFRHSNDVMADIVWRHDPVLVADQHDRLIVTRGAFDRVIASNDFVASLAGQPITSAEQRQRLATQLPDQFATLTSGQRQMLAFGEQRWLALQQRWHAMNEADRSRIAQQLRGQVTSPALVAVAARNLEQAALNRNGNGRGASSGSGAQLGQTMGAWWGMHSFLQGGGL